MLPAFRLKYGGGLKTNKEGGNVKLKIFHDLILTSLDGLQFKRHEVVDMILNCIGDDRKTCKQISDELNFSYQIIKNLIRKLVVDELIIGTPVKRYKYYSKLNKTCLLAEMFYNHENILKNFKIKKRKKHSLENSKNISSGSNMFGHVSAGHILDIIYEEGGI